MNTVARLKAAKWKLLGGVIASILLGGVGVRFWSLSPLSFSSPAPRSLASVNTATTTAKRNTLSPETPSGTAEAEMAAHKNPKTGRFEKPPVDSSRRTTLHQSAVPDRGAEPLPTDPSSNGWMSPVAGGGIVTNIRLRFRRPLVATKDADGMLTIQHAPEEADADEVQ